MSISLLRMIRGVLADRRGVTALAFAASSIGVFGAAALATEAGVWYSARRGLANAADVAATSGAMVLARQGSAAARIAAVNLAGRNGFAEGGANSVVVNIPPTSGAFTGDRSAVEVIVRQQQRLGMAAIVLASAPNVAGRSVAAMVDDRPVCILALSDEFRMSGSSAVDAPDCAIASNRASGRGISLGNNVRVTADKIVAVGTCDNCDGSGVSLTRGHQEAQQPVTNPYAHLDSKVLPSFNGATCLDPGKSPTSLAPYETNGRRAYCKDIDVTAGATLNLQPGTYYLHEASLKVAGGATIACPTCTSTNGVTIVLTGRPTKVGDIDVRGGANISNLVAPSNPEDPDFRGVLFYRDARATSGGTQVKINGGALMDLAGGLYFPTSDVEFSGGANTTGCIVLVAGRIEMKGNAQAAVRNCNATNTAVPRSRMAAVVE